jgi:hypothetical protein
MPAAVNKNNPVAITPPVHLEFIQNQAALVESDDEVESYHRALFLHQHAGELEQYRQQARIHEDRLNHLERRLNDARARLAATEKLVPVQLQGGADVQPNAPWNGWDRAMFAASAAGIAVLIIFGVLNISFNLLESGLVTFVENPVRAYFWAALLPAGALAVKIGWDLLESSRMQSIYLWTCLAAGVAGVLLWMGTYAAVYPALSKSVSESIQSLSVFENPAVPAAITFGGAKWTDALIVAGQAVAEIFLSAVLGIYMTSIYQRHRPVRLAGNPLFVQLDEERRALEESVARERLALAEANGHQTRLENQLEALVAYAKSMFRRESALRRDESRQRQQLLDEISEQLRNRLNAVPERNGNGNSPALRNHSTP